MKSAKENLGINVQMLNHVPSNVDFGFLPVGLKTVRAFELHNYSTTASSFSFTDCAFKIEPSKGTIEPGHSQKVSVVLEHNLTKVLITKTTFAVQHQGSKVVKMSAVFKCSHIEMKTDVVDFGICYLHSLNAVSVPVENVSEVTAVFKINEVHQENCMDDSIKCLTVDGRLDPGEKSVLKLRFIPTIESFGSIKRFEMAINGISTREFTVKGFSRKVQVGLDRHFHDFGNLKKEGSDRTFLIVTNKSKTPAEFVILNPSNAFTFDKSQGVISELSYAKINVAFQPPSDGRFVSRFFLFVRNQQLECFSLSGLNCSAPPAMMFQRKCNSIGKHSTKDCQPVQTAQLPPLLMKGCPKRPVDFKTDSHKELFQRQFSLFKLNSSKDPATPSNSRLKPLPSNALLRPNKFQLKSIKTETSLQNIDDAIRPKVGQLDNDGLSSNSAAFDQLFDQLECKESLLSLSTSYIEFEGLNAETGECGHKTVSVRNCSATKRLYVLPVLKSKAFACNAACFSIEPLCSYEVTVKFTPTRPAVISHKTMSLFASESPVFESSAALTADQRHHLLSSQTANEFLVHLIGHSFVERGHMPLPLFKLSPDKCLTFLPCRIGEAVYQGLTVSNPTEFTLVVKATRVPPPFSCLQEFLVVPKHSFGVFLFRFKPSSLHFHHSSFKLLFNFGFKKTFQLKALCHNQVLRIGNSGVVEFPACQIGLTQTAQVLVENISKSTGSFCVKTQDSHEFEACVTPSSFSLKEHERISLVCSFKPKRVKDFSLQLPILCLKDQAVTDSVAKLQLQCRTGDGQLSFDNRLLSFGFIKVNFEKRLTVLLVNHSDYLFRVHLCLRCDDKNKALGQHTLTFFQLSFTDCLLAGHTHKELHVTFRPTEVCHAKVKLLMVTKTDETVCLSKAFDGSQSEVGHSKEPQLLTANLSANNSKNASRFFAKTSTLKSKDNQSMLKSRIGVSTMNSAGEFPPNDCLNVTEGNGGSPFESISIRDEMLIEAEANFPLLKVVDMACEDLSSASLWYMFQVNDLNLALCGNSPSQSAKDELRRQSMNPTSSPGKKCFLWDYGYLPSSAEQSVSREIKMTVQNTGKTDLEWRFQMIGDDDLSGDPEQQRTRSEQNEDNDGGLRPHQTFKMKPRLVDKVWRAESAGEKGGDVVVLPFPDRRHQRDQSRGEVISDCTRPSCSWSFPTAKRSESK